jgi:hypothetical protein
VAVPAAVKTAAMKTTEATNMAMGEVHPTETGLPILGDIESGIAKSPESAVRMAAQGPAATLPTAPLSPTAVPVIVIPIVMACSPPTRSPSVVITPSAVAKAGIPGAPSVCWVIVASVISRDIHTSGQCKRYNHERYEDEQIPFSHDLTRRLAPEPTFNSGKGQKWRFVPVAKTASLSSNAHSTWEFS